MSHERIQQLINAIKLRQIKEKCHNFNMPSISDSIIETGSHQFQFMLRQWQKQYNSLLLDCLSLIELYEEVGKSQARDYNQLEEQMIRQRNDAACTLKQLESNLKREQIKIMQMRDTIANKQDQNINLRAQIQEREQRYTQAQSENRDNIAKIETMFNFRIVQQDKLHQSKIQRIIFELNAKISELETENSKFLQQNILLSSRLEQIIKHVHILQQTEKSESSPSKKNDLSPKILLNRNSQNGSCNQFSASSKSSENQVRRCLLVNEQVTSLEGRSGGRMILHEIMNTEDRKSINFGYNYYSKPKQFANDSQDQNINTLNQTQQEEQLKSKAKPLAMIQQFNARQAVMSSYLAENPYHIFFTITSQCAKINSENFEVAASLDIQSQWTHLLDSRVPLHQWYPFLLQEINKLIATA